MISGMFRAQSSTTSVSHVAHLDGSACITIFFSPKTRQKKKTLCRVRDEACSWHCSIQEIKSYSRVWHAASTSSCLA
jgi:hypothetical protein